MYNQSNSNLTIDEKLFLNKLCSMVEQDDQVTNYHNLIKHAPTDNKGEFWYWCAMILHKMPNNNTLDLREDGRLQVSLDIFTEMLKYNEKFPQLWAEKIIVLTFLINGHWAIANALSAPEEHLEKQDNLVKSRYFTHELLITLQRAVEKFPHDSWFIEEQTKAHEIFKDFI